MSPPHHSSQIEWYYESNGEQHGPVNHATVQQLIEHDVITADTQVWKAGLEDWQIASQTELATLLKPAQARPVTPPPLTTQTIPISQAERAAKKLNDSFIMLTTASLLMEINSIRTAFSDSVDEYQEKVVIFVIVFFFGLIPMFCLFLHKLWLIIHPRQTDIKPGQAIGFLFIPLFQFYWMVILALKLEEGLNAELEARNSHIRVSRPLWITSLIVGIVGGLMTTALPKEGVVFDIAGTVLVIVVYYQWKQAGVTVLTAKGTKSVVKAG